MRFADTAFVRHYRVDTALGARRGDLRDPPGFVGAVEGEDGRPGRPGGDARGQVPRQVRARQGARRRGQHA